MKSTRLAIELRASIFVAPLAAAVAACLVACLSDDNAGTGTEDSGIPSGEDATVTVDAAPPPSLDAGTDSTLPAEAGPDSSVGADAAPEAGPTTGTINGQVVDFMQLDYGILPNAKVAVVGGPQTTTDATGRFTLTGVQASARVLVNVTVPTDTANGIAYSSAQLVFALQGGQTVDVTAHVLEGCVATVNVSAGQTTSANLASACPARTVAYAGISFDDGALTEPDGGAYVGSAQIEIIPIESPPLPANEGTDGGLDYTWFEAFPGDMSASQADGGSLPLQSLGACEFRVYDASGQPLTIGPGHTATLDVPAFRAQGGSESFTGYYYDTTTGKWVEQGTGTFTAEEVGSGIANVFEIQVPHLTWWNIDQGTTNEGCVIGTITSGGAPFPNLLVSGTGVGWGGGGGSVTAADGTFCLDGLASSQMVVSATAQEGALTYTRAIGTLVTGAAGATCAGNRSACANAGATSIAALQPITPGCATGRVISPGALPDGGPLPVSIPLQIQYDYAGGGEPGSGLQGNAYAGTVTPGADGRFCVAYAPNTTIALVDPVNDFCPGGGQNSPSFAAPPIDGGAVACPTGCVDVGDISFFCGS